jgi:exodeoxyribonuclease V gamma subunit
VAIDLGGLRLSGWLDRIWPCGVVEARPSKADSQPRFKDFMTLWLRHLILNALPETPCARTSRFIGQEAVWEFPPVDDAMPLLAALARLYQAGQQRPLPLFPETSYEYAWTRWRGGSGDEPERRARAWNVARKIWERGRNFLGLDPEREDPYLRAAFGDGDPLDGRDATSLGFAAVAETVLARPVADIVKVRG